jgi:hypothetical protein
MAPGQGRFSALSLSGSRVEDPEVIEYMLTFDLTVYKNTPYILPECNNRHPSRAYLSNKTVLPVLGKGISSEADSFQKSYHIQRRSRHLFSPSRALSVAKEPLNEARAAAFSRPLSTVPHGHRSSFRRKSFAVLFNYEDYPPKPE